VRWRGLRYGGERPSAGTDAVNRLTKTLKNMAYEKHTETEGKAAVVLPRIVRRSLVENRGGVWMMSGKPCQSCAREIAESAMTALLLDPSDFRLRDKIIVAIAPKVEAMMDAARTANPRL
jgi:hypothetical protein